MNFKPRWATTSTNTRHSTREARHVCRHNASRKKHSLSQTETSLSLDGRSVRRVQRGSDRPVSRLSGSGLRSHSAAHSHAQGTQTARARRAFHASATQHPLSCPFLDFISNPRISLHFLEIFVVIHSIFGFPNCLCLFFVVFFCFFCFFGSLSRGENSRVIGFREFSV